MVVAGRKAVGMAVLEAMVAVGILVTRRAVGGWAAGKVAVGLVAAGRVAVGLVAAGRSERLRTLRFSTTRLMKQVKMQ